MSLTFRGISLAFERGFLIDEINEHRRHILADTD